MAAATTAAPGGRTRPAFRDRIIGTIWAGVWMFPLINPVAAALTGGVPHEAFALAGLGGFTVVYLTVVVNGFDVDHVRSWYDYAMLAAVGVIGYGLMLPYGTYPSGWLNLAIYVAVAGVAVLDQRPGIAWAAASIAVLLVFGLWPRGDSIVVGTVSAAISAALASGLVFTVRQMQRYISALHATRRKLARTAVAEERERFSRDLHDLLGHTLSLIVVKAEVVRRLADQDPEAVAREAGEIEEIGRRALAEVREAVTGYREPQFATELDRARDALGDAGVEVTVQEIGGPVPGPAGAALAWAIREAATNVIRHAHARACRITVRVTEAQAILVVADDGTGAVGTDVTGTGLLGLQERLAAAGGTLRTDSGGGFRLTATVPLAPATVPV